MAEFKLIILFVFYFYYLFFVPHFYCFSFPSVIFWIKCTHFMMPLYLLYLLISYNPLFCYHSHCFRVYLITGQCPVVLVTLHGVQESHSSLLPLLLSPALLHSHTYVLSMWRTNLITNTYIDYFHMCKTYSFKFHLKLLMDLRSQLQWVVLWHS